MSGKKSVTESIETTTTSIYIFRYQQPLLLIAYVPFITWRFHIYPATPDIDIPPTQNLQSLLPPFTSQSTYTSRSAQQSAPQTSSAGPSSTLLSRRSTKSS
jgi:hypothetical protein